MREKFVLALSLYWFFRGLHGKLVLIQVYNKYNITE